MPSAKPSSSKNTPTRTPSDEQELLPYILSGVIGNGSFATVYRGHHEVTRDQVAVKVVSRSILTTKLFENLQSEIEILKRLHHHHVTQLIDIIRAERNIYLIMEFCAGGDLSMYIKRRGKIESLYYTPAPGAAPIYYPHPRSGGLDEVVVRAFLRQLARALKFLRFHNLIHRDIKPQNLLLTPALEEDFAKGHPLGVPLLKLADFGFARVLPNATLAETLCGSPLYMAPEILRYEKYDAKADLWSVGAVLYEMSVGGPPFRAQNHIELLKKIERARSTVTFPDEDTRAASPEAKQVAADIKLLIRALLKHHPVERASYDDFFRSEALEKSKFRRPEKRKDTISSESVQIQRATKDPWVFDPTKGIPESHKYIPPEVLDPKANIPPSTFKFRRREDFLKQNSEKRAGSSPGPGQPVPSPRNTAPKRGSPLAPTRNLYESPKHLTKELPNPGLEGVNEELSDHKEYVLVDDSKSVEFNKAVDEVQGYRQVAHRDRVAAKGGALDPSPFPLSQSPPKPIAGSMYPPQGPNNDNKNSPSPDIAPGFNTTGRTASGALSRALSKASRKLFGDSPPSHSCSIKRRSAGESYRATVERDAEEDALLTQLEDLAQKTHVIVRWCDDMQEKVLSFNDNASSGTGSLRRKGTLKAIHTDTDPDGTPVTCISLYMLLMSFAQRGIDSVKAYQDYLRSLDPSEEVVLGGGFEDALVWFRDLFFQCQARVISLKPLLPSEFGSDNLSVQLVIYNHAIQLSRAAARKELLDQMSSNDECEKRYEEALWCLYAIRDDIMQQGISSREEEQNMVEYEITRTKLRLHRCRVRMKMDDVERIRDARADHNLDDVQRFPPPWEIPTSS